MKGLEISRQFAAEWLLPFIEGEMPGLRSRIALGRFSGSDAIGVDDALSQDHNWGPTVELYLDDDYEADDAALAARINAAAPREFHGTTRRGGHDSAVTLRRTQAYVDQVFGGTAPVEPRDWVCCLPNFEAIESALYFLRHGALFHDGSGRLTALRERYHAYPDDVHRLRLAGCCFDIAHYGEYNFVWRLVERNDLIAMQIALGQFSSAVMRLHFYLDRDYAPYWKWLPHEFRRRGFAPTIHEQLVTLPRLMPKKQAVAIQGICAELAPRVIAATADVANPHNVPWFFRVRDEIANQIADPAIRRLTY